jgi:iron complex outermembrane recepter protein
MMNVRELTHALYRPGARRAAWLLLLATQPVELAVAADAPLENNTPGQPVALDEIVVTSQRVEQKIQDVPIAVTALSGDEMLRKGVTNIANLQMSVPNFNVSASPVGGDGGAQIFVRGVGQLDYTATQEPDVPIYVDGVYVARPVGAVFDFVDVDRVEVLRGPQGTLFGRNALGGAVQIVTQAPTDTFGGYAQVTAGNFGRRDVDGAVNLPLAEDLALRVTGSSRSDDGYTTSVVTGQRGNDYNNETVRAQLRWHPDGWNILVRVDDVKHQSHSGLQTLTQVTNTPTLAAYNSMLAAQGLPQITAALVPTDPYHTVSGFEPPDQSEEKSGSLEITHDFAAFSLKSISAYRKLDAISGFDFTGTPYPYLTEQTTTHETEFTQELQLYGKTLEDKLSWIAGAYLFHEVNHQPQQVIIDQDVTRTGPGEFDFAALQGTGIEELTALDQTSDSYALYGQASYEVLPKLNATLGLRASWDYKRLGSSAGAGDYTNVRPYGFQSDTWDQVTPKFGLDYKIVDNVMAYASASEGYRAGGFDGHATASVLPNAYGAEKLWDYEGGIKSDLFDHRLRVNFGGFYYDYKNYQASYNALINGVIGVIVDNVAAVRMYGAELETRMRVTEQLELSAYATEENINFHNLVPGTDAVRLDSQPPNAPKSTVGASAEYTAAIASWGTASLRGDYAYKSSTQFFLPNLPGEAQGGYSVTNARLTFAPNDDRYELSLYGTNIFDKQYKVYAQSIAASFGTVIGSYAPPAQYGATLKVKF